MGNKFINLFFQDLNLRLKIVAVVLLTALCLFLQRGALLKKLEAARLGQDKILAQELAKKIPGLEKQLEALRKEGNAIGLLPRNINFVLSGMFIKDGEPVALINDNVYQKNDIIDGFVILEITARAVILEDIVTKKKRELNLSQ